MTPPPKKGGRTASRWSLKHQISSIIRAAAEPEGSTPSVCKCGTARHDAESVSLTRSGDRPGVAGVFFCDSPWLCPSCAPRRAARRAERVGQVFDAIEAKGGSVVFLTLTVSHKRGEALAGLKSLVSGACRKARQGKPWAKAAAEHGIQGVIVGPEVTWSPWHGWHYHLHLAVPMMSNDEKALEAGEWLIGRYLSYIHAAGGKAVRHAQDVQVVWSREDLQTYISKGSAHWEVASAGATKEGSGGGKTPWDLAALAAGGDAASRAAFLEYVAVMPGTRSCVISPALARKLGLEADADDDEPGSDEVDETEALGDVDRSVWHKLLRQGHVPLVFQTIADGAEWPAIQSVIDRLVPPMIDPIFERYRNRPKPPPPDCWHPTDHEILSLVSIGGGRSTGSVVGATWAALEATAASKKLPLDCSQVRVMRLVTGLYGAL